MNELRQDVKDANAGRARSVRLMDAAIFLSIMAILAGVYVRTRHPDAVSGVLTDLSRREVFIVTIAVPGPWRRPPLSELPRAGDSEIADGDRDYAEFKRLEIEASDTSWPKAVFRVRARVDPEGLAWYNYAQVIPGANFTFRTPRYAMEGIVLEVTPSSGS